MSFYTMALFGHAAFGSLLSGTLAARIGATDTIFVGGTACVLGALLFLRELPELRRIARPTYCAWESYRRRRKRRSPSLPNSRKH
jgi:hypothetical protein